MHMFHFGVKTVVLLALLSCSVVYGAVCPSGLLHNPNSGYYMHEDGATLDNWPWEYRCNYFCEECGEAYPCLTSEHHPGCPEFVAGTCPSGKGCDPNSGNYMHEDGSTIPNWPWKYRCNYFCGECGEAFPCLTSEHYADCPDNKSNPDNPDKK